MRIPSDEKYLNDSQFRSLVDQMLFLITKLDTSFSEIREACLFAQLKYEMSHPQLIKFSSQLEQEFFFRTRLEGK